MTEHAIPAPAAGQAHGGAAQVRGGSDIVEEGENVLAQVERALAERPNISIGLRIWLSMLLCFLLVAGVVLTSIVFVSKVGALQEFLDKVSTYAFEVEHARRYEKNYFLYGTGLEDTLTQVQAAHQHLRSIRAAVIATTGPQAFEKMEANLEEYDRLLERLVGLARQPAGNSQEERTRIASELRRHGTQIIADATDLVDQERLRLRVAVRIAWIVAAASLVFILLVMAFVAYMLTCQVANPLRRFIDYTQRIAKGDYSPILPARRYRDEFSQLAVAINRMLWRLKDRENQLARTSRMAAVGTLTAGVAHELNNPLNNIALNAEAMHESLDAYTDAQKLKMLADIRNQVDRASATVRNLLDFTRVEKPVLVSLSLKDVVAEARRLVANEAEINHVEFRVEMPERLPRVRGSPRDLQQVFLNLFLNSIQAMPNGGLLTVRGKISAAGSIDVEVTDTGSGIPEEVVGSIFDPFFTTKEAGAGSGLGLFISYGIIEKHKGSIAVRSKPGEGTTLIVSLPIASEGAAETSAGQEA
jgi:two-component system, NtrC family, sensor kinase